METALAIGSIVAGVASAGAGIAGAASASKAARAEVAQHEQEMQLAAIAADQEEVTRRRKLEGILAQNEALRGARGLALDTGTARALRESNIAEAEDDISTIRLNKAGLMQRSAYGIESAKMRASTTMLSGIGSAIGSLGSAGTTALRYWPKA